MQHEADRNVRGNSCGTNVPTRADVERYWVARAWHQPPPHGRKCRSLVMEGELAQRLLLRPSRMINAEDGALGGR